MKSKKLLYSFLFHFASIFISINVSGQIIVLSDKNNQILNNGDTIVVTGDTSTFFSVGIKVEIFSSNLDVKVLRTKIIEIYGSECYFTWGTNMYDTSIVLTQSVPITSGVIDSSFISYYYSFGNLGSSIYKYRFSDDNHFGPAWVYVKYNVINTTGILENILGTLSIHPNPGNGLYHLSFSSLINSDISTEVFNSAGKLILKKNYNQYNSPYIIDLLNYPDGIYFLKIYDENKQYFKTFKLVKIQ